MTGTLSPPIPIVGQPNSAEDPITKEALEYLRNGLNAILASDNTVDPALFNTANKIKYKFYEPKAIATEENRTNTSFGTLTTPDEITNVVVPENGKLIISYSCLVKSSVAAAGRVAIFLGANQLKKTFEAGPNEANTVGTIFGKVATRGESGLVFAELETTYGTTGHILIGTEVGRLLAGTYAISIQFKSTSGTITAKERLLNVEVHG